MPLLGLGLLLVGAIGVYLFISPGVLSTDAHAGGDGGADGDAAVVAAP